MTYRLSGTTHFLTVDVADWTSDPNVAAAVARRNFDPLQDRPSETVNALLDRLGAANTRATFFVAGPVARRDASLVRRIANAGHEVAACGAAGLTTEDELRADARTVKRVVEDAMGAPVVGFRTPGVGNSITKTTSPLVRFETLIEEGFEYDSSRLPRAANNPMDHGVPNYPQTIVCSAGTLIEVPLLQQPFARGSLSMRSAPYAAVHQVFASRTHAGLPGVVAFATWEIDRDQPKVKLPLFTSWRHHRGRGAARDRVERLVRDFRFDAIGHRLSELAEQAPPAYSG